LTNIKASDKITKSFEKEPVEKLDLIKKNFEKVLDK